MKLKHFFFLIAILFSIHFYGQNTLSEEATVSVVTCGPGAELYSSFGHSAFRVFDPINKIDNIYNYGTFDAGTDNFYMKFAQGRLNYTSQTSYPMYF